nr:MAG TPA: hypothetical protein [Caudoviricetes sp.]
MEVINLPLLVPARVIDSALWLPGRDIDIDVLISSLSEFHYVSVYDGLAVGSDVHKVALGVVIATERSGFSVGNTDIGAALVYFVSPDSHLGIGSEAGFAQQFALRLKDGIEVGSSNLSLGYVKYVAPSGGFTVGTSVEMNVTSPITIVPSALRVGNSKSVETRLLKSLPVSDGTEVGVRCQYNSDVWANLSASGLCLRNAPSVSLILYARLRDYDGSDLAAMDERTMEDLDVLD